MKELGALINITEKSAFFKIRGYSHLGIKVSITQDSRINYFSKEVKLSRIFHKYDLPVPRFIGIKKVTIPETFNHEMKMHKFGSYFFDMTNIHNSINKFQPGNVISGVFMEVIDGDIKAVNKNQLRNLYDREVKKFHDLGIFPADNSGSRNVLWCERRKKLYFIDYESWHLPRNIRFRLLF